MKLQEILNLVKCTKCKDKLFDSKGINKIETHYSCNCKNAYSVGIATDFDENILFVALQLRDKPFVDMSSYREFIFYPKAIDNGFYKILLDEQAFLKLIENFDIKRISEKYDTLMLFK